MRERGRFSLPPRFLPRPLPLVACVFGTLVCASSSAEMDDEDDDEAEEEEEAGEEENVKATGRKRAERGSDSRGGNGKRGSKRKRW